MASKILNCCIKSAGWCPVIFISGIILWSYYAYVFVLCIENVKSDLERGVLLLCYHPFFLMLLWAYWRAVWTLVGTVPKQFFLSIEDREKLDNTDNPQQVLEEFSRKLPINTVTISGAVRYCEICNSVKPDRGHHCSICKSCVLKMDHHCPWVNNCVGFSNYKFFLLFLFYAILYTFYVACTVFKYFLRFWNNTLDGEGKLHILFLFFVAAMFFISLWSLFGYHTFLTMKNRSTLESFRVPNFRYGPDKNGFNLGTLKNIKQVLGETKLLWLIPVFTSLGDGVSFPLSRRAPESDSLLSSPGHWLEDGEGESSEERKTLELEDSYHVEVINEEEPLSDDENIEINHEGQEEEPAVDSDEHDLTPAVAIESVAPDITACHSEHVQNRDIHESKNETLSI